MNYSQVVLPGMWHHTAPVLYGWENCSPGHSFGPAVRSYYLLHYVLEGEGTFLRADGEYPVSKGDIFVIRPGEVTTYRASEDNPWVYVWLGFETKGEMPFLHQAVLRGMPVRHIFTAIRDYSTADGGDGKVFALTYELLWLLGKESVQELQAGNRYAEYLKMYMDNSYMNQIRFGVVAEQLHIDRRYLTALFRERYGQSPQSYLMELRLGKADLFLGEGYSVTDAAVMSGFSDLSNFSCRYKARYGISPRQRLND